MTAGSDQSIVGETKNFIKKIAFLSPLYRLLSRSKRALIVFSRRISGARSFPRNDFESIFRLQDPWQYSNPHQQERLGLLIDRVPAVPRALEIGCAEGTFTELLSRRAKHVVATDISLTALRRAYSLCANAANVSFVQADMLNLPLQREFDVIICAGVLVYLPEFNLFETTVRRIVQLIRPNGILVIENMWRNGGGTLSGERIHNYLIGDPHLQMQELLMRDEYAISVFQNLRK